jgi:nitrate reductase (NAD(P)H)
MARGASTRFSRAYSDAIVNSGSTRSSRSFVPSFLPSSHSQTLTHTHTQQALPIPFLTLRNEAREGDIPDAAILTAAAALGPTQWFLAPTTSTAAPTITPPPLPPDCRDVGSPDAWIPRDGRLVRLTGKHPFNVEPPLAVLEQSRFLTPSSLHYVRNHGAVPVLGWDTHTIVVSKTSGDSTTTTTTLCRSRQFSMDDLVQMRPVRELPVTLVCAGNRRKEQNMIRQTIGFNWGPSGVSTNVWKGVLLRDVLLQAGVVVDDDNSRSSSMRNWHVEFIGVEDLPNKVGVGPFADTEPWGKLVKYGTSLPLARCMNAANDILLAYEANGERLQPDHGFPVRLIIPGYIGGRMIKWLKYINVIDHETRNHYQ